MVCVYEGCELKVRVKSGKNLVAWVFGRGLGLEKPMCCFAGAIVVSRKQIKGRWRCHPGEEGFTYLESSDFFVKDVRIHARIIDGEFVTFLDDSVEEEFFELHLAAELEYRAPVSSCVLNP